jgi:hypothetical protein
MLQVGSPCVPIPNKVIGFFQFTQSFQQHYGLGLTQSLGEMSTMHLPGGKGHLVRKTDNLAAKVYVFFSPM